MAINELLLKLEDPKMPLLGPNVKALKFFGLLLSEKSFARNAMIFIKFGLLLLLTLVLQWIEVWQTSNDDVNLVLNNLRFTLVNSVTMLKICTMFRSQKEWKQIIQYVTKTDILSRSEVDESCRKIVKSYTKYCQRFMYIYWTVVCTVLVTMISPIPFPLVKYYTSKSFQDDVNNGTLRMEHMVVSFWVPFDKHYSIAGYTVVGIYEACGILYSGLIIPAFDSLIIVIMVFFRGELELLSEVGSRIFDDDDEAAVWRNNLECRQRYSDFIKHVTMFKQCISPVMFVYLLVSSFSLCACAYQITIEPDLAQKLFKVSYTVFVVMQLFGYFWHGNLVTHMSFEPMLGVYKSAWWKKPIYRKELIILLMQFDRTIVFNAGPTFELTMETFLAILKGAYSYYAFFAK